MKENEYFVVYNSMENAHDFGMLTQRKLIFEEAVKEIKEDAEARTNEKFIMENFEKEFEEELEHLENNLEVEMANRLYRIVLIKEE